MMYIYINDKRTNFYSERCALTIVQDPQLLPLTLLAIKNSLRATNIPTRAQAVHPIHTSHTYYNEIFMKG